MNQTEQTPIVASEEPALRPILVWDFPTRILHWALTVSVLGALAMATAAEGHATLFQLHMLLGLFAAFVVAVRVFWGFIGSRYARFGSFLFGPLTLWRYLRAAVGRRDERHVGHNPGSSYAAYAMLGAAVVLGVTGVLAARGSEAAEDLHGPVAHLLVLVVLAHLAGIVWHTVRHRESVALGMVTGRKAGRPDEAIKSAHPAAGVGFLALCLGAFFALVAGFDSAARSIRLPLLGTRISLSAEHEKDAENAEHAEDAEHKGRERDGEHAGDDGHERKERSGDDDDHD